MAKNRQKKQIKINKNNKKGIKKSIKIKNELKKRYKKSLKIGNLFIYWCGIQAEMVNYK